MESPQLWSNFEKTAQDGRNATLSDEQLTTATTAMAVVLLYSSVQRPSAVSGLTLNELKKARPVGDVWVLSVASHKTAVKGPARLTLDETNMDRLNDYVDYMTTDGPPAEGATPAGKSPT